MYGNCIHSLQFLLFSSVKVSEMFCQADGWSVVERLVSRVATPMLETLQSVQNLMRCDGFDAEATQATPLSQHSYDVMIQTLAV